MTKAPTVSKSHSNDVSDITDAAHELLVATEGVAGNKIAEARKRLSEGLEVFRAGAQERIRATDTYVRENPYKSLGVVFGIGAALGLLLACRKN